MRSDFALDRFVCTTDDNIAVIMQVQFLRKYNPGFHVVYTFQSTRYKGSIKCAIAFSFMLLSWANC